MSEKGTEDAVWDEGLATQAPRRGLHFRKESQTEPQVKVWERREPRVTCQTTWGGGAGWEWLCGYFLQAGHVLAVASSSPH